MAEKRAFHETYVRAAGAVAFVAIIDAKGDEGIGSAFHIGNGIFVTARHVINGVTIKEIATTKSAHLTVGGRRARVMPKGKTPVVNKTIRKFTTSSAWLSRAPTLLRASARQRVAGS